MAPAKGERVGRALVTQSEEGDRWTFEPSDRALCERFARWGDHGLTGFERTENPLVLVRAPVRAVSDFDKRERIDPARALSLVARLASALAVAEEEAIAIGRVRLSNIGFDRSGHAHISIDSVVATFVGAPEFAHSIGDSSSSIWIPPEQANGAPWTAAANRYVVGLIVYRLLSGAHPFAGAGVRHAMDAGSTAASPPPFDKRTAAELLPGLQSLILRMIARAEVDRPPSARAIADECEKIAERNVEPPALAESRPRSLWRTTENAKDRRGNGPLSAARGWWMACVAGAIAIAFSASRGHNDEPSRASAVRPQLPLARAESESCASCHAEEYRQWKDSVMAHAAKSPLFGALESAIEEQIGKSDACPSGAGALRAPGRSVCIDTKSGITTTGTGGEGWCVNCHAPGIQNESSASVRWDTSVASSRAPLRDLLGREAMHGVSCVSCHTTVHAAGRTGSYVGNRTWRSPFTGVEFLSRPEERRGENGIANSGYLIDPSMFLGRSKERAGEPIVHRRPPSETSAYLATSEFCGACHDVRLFGTDSLGVRNGEHFKRLRNAYSEWRVWADEESLNGRTAPTCQGCHMSLYPGICASGPGAQNGCPSGTHFESRSPGARSASGRASHYFTSVDLPLSPSFPDDAADSTAIDADGVPVGLRARREMLLRRALRFDLLPIERTANELRIPIEIENVGAGHRVPAGFSQEREIWVELIVRDATGKIVYEAGTIDRSDEDLHDKIFLRTTTSIESTNRSGAPLGMFGADLIDGRDTPAWRSTGRNAFVGRGLINLQNGFLRCVRCIGFIDSSGECQPANDAQNATRMARYDDGDYDIDTGECRSNLDAARSLVETYFPIGALDASRGIVKGPDAIIDTRSAAPGETLRYTSAVPIAGAKGPFRVNARLRFRAFPPFLVRAFADYEREQERIGARPSGAQVVKSMMDRIDIVDLAEAERRSP